MYLVISISSNARSGYSLGQKQPLLLPGDDGVLSPPATVFHNPVTISLVLVSNCMAAIEQKNNQDFEIGEFLLRTVVDVVVVVVVDVIVVVVVVVVVVDVTVVVSDLKTDASAILRPMIAPRRRERHPHASNSCKQE